MKIVGKEMFEQCQSFRVQEMGRNMFSYKTGIISLVSNPGLYENILTGTFKQRNDIA